MQSRRLWLDKLIVDATSFVGENSATKRSEMNGPSECD